MTTTETAIARREAPELTPFEVMERVITSGDLSQMSPQDRVAFYWRSCESLGLNPLTRPFDFIRDREGKIVMYARKDATDQLRNINGVSVVRLDREQVGDLAQVIATGRDRFGREDSSLGAVSIKGLGGEALANAWMKAETKAKRRMTLSLVGLGFLDETEVGTVGSLVDFNPETGELLDEPKPKPKNLLAAVEQQTASLAGTDGDGASTSEAPETSPDPEPPAEDQSVVDAILAEPMTVEQSAAIGGIVDEMGIGDVVDEDEAALLEQLAAAKAPKAPGLSLQDLAELARRADVGKLRFASVLDIVPADVGARVEAMTDEKRWDLALQLGLVEG